MTREESTAESSVDTDDSESSQIDSGENQQRSSFTFGPTEYSIVPTPPEDWTPAKRAAAMVIGATAMLVGICGLLGIRVEPRGRYWSDDR
jgi:hypothetical protein